MAEIMGAGHDDQESLLLSELYLRSRVLTSAGLSDECVITITQYQSTVCTQDILLFPCQDPCRVQGDSGHVMRGISSSLPCSSSCTA